MRSLLLLFFMLSLSSCYTLEQAYWFNNAYNSRIPVEDVLRDLEPGEDQSLRGKLLLSREVLQFARREGLNVGSAYEHFIPEQSAQVSYLVQAAPADKLEPMTWWFPIIGRVPYLGYFNREQRDAMAKSLKEQGYDISLGSVGAFSSLGWFDDPIYASMTKREDDDFVELLLHELVHRTFWSRGSAAFNENLAAFLGYHLAVKFLEQSKGGRGVENLAAERKDQEKLRAWLQALKGELEAVYADPRISRERKLTLKAETIRRFREEKFPPMLSTAYAAAKNRDWNNASILASSLYSPDSEKFERAYRCSGAIKAGLFLKAIKAAEAGGLDAEAALASLCIEHKRISLGFN